MSQNTKMKWQKLLRRCGAALVATAAFVPGAAALVTVLLFFLASAPYGEIYSPCWGTGIALLVWIILAPFFLRFADAKYAVPSSYGELSQRLDLLKSQLSVVCPVERDLSVLCSSKACKQAKTQVEKITDELAQKGLPWALARGYINVWSRLHLAEEAMIEVAPQETVISGALNDVLRLQGSKIDHSEDLITRLEQAIEIIDPSANIYYKKVAATALMAAPGGESDPKTQARVVMRDVRSAINNYRDGCWNGMIVARNRLIATMIFTGMTAYTLLAIAIFRGAQKPAIAAASVFYLIGATIGLLNQLRNVSQSDTAVEDYGLSSARLITMPLFCGLAAIGGVGLMAMPQMASYSSVTIPPLTITTPTKLPMGVFDKLYYQKIDAAGGTPPYIWATSSGPLPEGIDFKPTGDFVAKLPKRPEPKKSSESIRFTAQVKDSTGLSVEKSFFLNITSVIKTSAEYQPPPIVSMAHRPLEDIFDLHKNIFGLFLAAVFGLTPGMLFDRLQQQDEKYKINLKSSEATQVKPQMPG